jgi:glucosyl-dolichyl phosphate glucuronosyltransferase
MAIDITVAICTWNRAASLSDTLEVLTTQRVPTGIEWECVVVNNHCTDNTDDVLAEFVRRLPIRRVFEPIAGISRARNAAIREARGELVLFLDDDERADPEWIAAYADASARWPSASYFGGRIEPRFLSEPPAYVTANSEALAGIFGIRDFGPTQRMFRDGEAPYGGNMAIRRKVFADMVFDENLGHRHADRVMGEETQFFEKLNRRDERGVWVPEAKVKHRVPPENLTADGIYRHFFTHGRTVFRRKDKTRTWILKFPKSLSRVCCALAHALVAFGRAAGMTNWVVLHARCATWEGMLTEAEAELSAARAKLLAPDGGIGHQFAKAKAKAARAEPDSGSDAHNSSQRRI